jgi:RNA-binding motif X-linked protein 2
LCDRPSNSRCACCAGRRYGEIVDLNLVREKGTGKSKGFCFVAYEDQRSTVLAVDNLNGFQVRSAPVLSHSGSWTQPRVCGITRPHAVLSCSGVRFGLTTSPATRKRSCGMTKRSEKSSWSA